MVPVPSTSSSSIACPATQSDHSKTLLQEDRSDSELSDTGSIDVVELVPNTVTNSDLLKQKDPDDSDTNEVNDMVMNSNTCKKEQVKDKDHTEPITSTIE